MPELAANFGSMGSYGEMSSKAIASPALSRCGRLRLFTPVVGSHVDPSYALVEQQEDDARSRRCKQVRFVWSEEAGGWEWKDSSAGLG